MPGAISPPQRAQIAPPSAMTFALRFRRAWWRPPYPLAAVFGEVGAVILVLMSRSVALLVGIVCFVAFLALYALSWIAAFGFLALWLAATVLYRRKQRR